MTTAPLAFPMPWILDRTPNGDGAHPFPVGLEEGADGATLVHALTLPGCVAAGGDRDAALAAFPSALAAWLHFLGSRGEAVPPPDGELEIAVEEWIRVDGPSTGTSAVLFDADRAPLTPPEIEIALQRLGDLRGQVLAELRAIPDAELDRLGASEWSPRTIAEELARAQWWTLTRLGASPMAEIPPRTLARLDTAMALVVQAFTDATVALDRPPVEIEGELWTPRRVLRHLLWLEWTLGESLLRALAPATARS